MRRVMVLVLVALGCVLFSQAPAQACERPVPSMSKALAKSTFVFSGTVRKATSAGDQTTYERRPRPRAAASRQVRSSRQLPQRAAEKVFEAHVGGRVLDDRVEGLVDRRRRVAEVHERRDDVAARTVRTRRSPPERRGRPWAGDRAAPASCARPLAADAGDPRQSRHVALLHGADEIGRLDPGQHRQRQLGPDAVDGDEPLEQIVLQRRREPEQRDLILGRTCVWMRSVTALPVSPAW